MAPRRHSLLLLSILFIGIEFHCYGQDADRPNILWIVSEDNSKHYLDLFDSTGAATPNIAWLADEGVKFTRAFSNSPVCSVARSTLITGCYGPRIGTQFHRGIEKADLSDTLKLFPSLLREVGYYTTNNDKEDYNIKKGSKVWDNSSKTATWKNREKGQPFFHQQNIFISHESSLHFPRETMDTTTLITDMDKVDVFPIHPKTELFKFTNAYYRDLIMQMDEQVGEIISKLKQDNLLDNTIIFYFGDHGGVLPGSKGYVYESGVHVPLVVYIPKKLRKQLGVNPGNVHKGFVSFVDLAPTVLDLAGVAAPELMDGHSVFGDKASESNTAFSYADRFDEKYDMVRAVRFKNYKYIRNFQPLNIDALRNNYRYRQLAYQQWLELFEAGNLNDEQSAFFKIKPAEMLFDLEHDPYETKNLATDPAYQEVLDTMRMKLNTWIIDMPDMSFYPEFYLLKNKAFENPLNFGSIHRDDIKAYLNIANLGTEKFSEVKEKLLHGLKAKDPWKRYWAIHAVGSLELDSEVVTIVREIAYGDPELINKVKAAEYLSIKNEEDQGVIIKKALYESEDPAEALLILNSLVLYQTLTGSPHTIKESKINKRVASDNLVKRRLGYLRSVGDLEK